METYSTGWMKVELERSEMAAELEQVRLACHTVHLLALDELQKHWTEHLEVPRSSAMQKWLTEQIRSNRSLQIARRYTLTSVVENTIKYFHEESRIVDEGDRKAVVLPNQLPLDQFDNFRIASRRIWSKYIFEYGRISTPYGMIFLPSDWREILGEQAAELNIPLQYLPTLAHSATFWKRDSGIGAGSVGDSEGTEWWFHLNPRSPVSRKGKAELKRAKKEMGDVAVLVGEGEGEGEGELNHA